jgi:hypothetical protein
MVHQEAAALVPVVAPNVTRRLGFATAGKHKQWVRHGGQAHAAERQLQPERVNGKARRLFVFKTRFKSRTSVFKRAKHVLQGQKTYSA